MLKEAIELQKKAVNKLIEVIDEKDEVTFRAPTGSGKTFMMADFMNQILSKNPDVVFLVSTLSKGNLAEQNYEKFLSYSEMGRFPYLNTFLINSRNAEEEALYIPTDFNVYLLPRDLYKKGGRLMKGGMEQFLNTLTMNQFFNGLEKKIYLIKDECHVATNNLDSLSDSFFEKIINFSATPNLKRGQSPDVEITDDEAVEVKLIKNIEYGDEEDTAEDAINKFEIIKEEYRNLLGINPCLIIQISNKDKATEELNNNILPVLQKAKHQDLKWMLIVDKEKECETNDVFKTKRIPISKWKDYAKENTSTIDIIIFKMVISEGWDIPRACMLYQVRKTQSEQLDEQVIGRVRRNPRLLDFEDLDEKAKSLASTSWVWGNPSEKAKMVRSVKLFDDPNDIRSEVKIKTTRIKRLKEREKFSITDIIDENKVEGQYTDIFTLYRELQKEDNDIREFCYEYADSYEKWYKFNNSLDKIVTESKKYICNYETSMELEKNDDGKIKEVSFPEKSFYTDNGNYENINDWVWKRTDGSDRFSFDSEAEREWADILKDLTKTNFQNSIKKIVVGKNNPNYGKMFIEDSGKIIETPEKIDGKEKFLWGKNFISNSEIKYEYYLDGIYASYPDFILKDQKDNLHIFEVKSVNISHNLTFHMNEEQYKRKIDELKKCYKQASKITGHYFYLPVLKGNNWFITKYENGQEKNITKEQFINSFAD